MLAQKTTKLIGVPHEYEAQLIASALRDRGIESQVVGGVMADFRAECPGLVDVLVREDDALAAVAALNDLNTKPREIDWDNVDVGESEDGQSEHSESECGEDSALVEAEDSPTTEFSLLSRSFVLITMIVMSVLYLVAAIGVNFFDFEV